MLMDKRVRSQIRQAAICGIRHRPSTLSVLTVHPSLVSTTNHVRYSIRDEGNKTHVPLKVLGGEWDTNDFLSPKWRNDTSEF